MEESNDGRSGAFITVHDKIEINDAPSIPPLGCSLFLLLNFGWTNNTYVDPVQSMNTLILYDFVHKFELFRSKYWPCSTIVVYGRYGNKTLKRRWSLTIQHNFFIRLSLWFRFTFKVSNKMSEREQTSWRLFVRTFINWMYEIQERSSRRLKYIWFRM